MTTTTDPFSPPASSVKVTDFDGRLILVNPKEAVDDVPTTFGPADAIRCAVVVLDADGGPEVHEDVLIFQKVLGAQLRPKITPSGDGWVLGRLGTGAAKAGQSAPWKLVETTEAENQTARDWFAARNAPPF